MATTQSLLTLVSDTLNIVLHNQNALITNTGSTGFDFKPYAVAIGAIGGAIIGALITIWTKRKEFENISENLKLQKMLFEETKLNNEHKMKAEIIKLQDLRKEYELHVKKHGHEMLRDVLKYANHESSIDKDKIAAVREYSLFIDKVEPAQRYDFEEMHEHQEWIVTDVYFNLDIIIDGLKKYLLKYPHVFSEINEKINACKDLAGNILAAVNREKDPSSPNPEYDEIFTQFDKILKVHQDLKDILIEMTAEFKELESIRKKFVTEQAKKG